MTNDWIIWWIWWLGYKNVIIMELPNRFCGCGHWAFWTWDWGDHNRSESLWNHPLFFNSIQVTVYIDHYTFFTVHFPIIVVVIFFTSVFIDNSLPSLDQVEKGVPLWFPSHSHSFLQLPSFLFLFCLHVILPLSVIFHFHFLQGLLGLK